MGTPDPGLDLVGHGVQLVLGGEAMAEQVPLQLWDLVEVELFFLVVPDLLYLLVHL